MVIRVESMCDFDIYAGSMHGEGATFRVQVLKKFFWIQFGAIYSWEMCWLVQARGRRSETVRVKVACTQGGASGLF